MVDLAVPLLSLFAASFAAATLVPLPSEAALFAYLQLHPAHVALAVLVATLGNTAGGMTSYLLGRFMPWKNPDSRSVHWLRRSLSWPPAALHDMLPWQHSPCDADPAIPTL